MRTVSERTGAAPAERWARAVDAASGVGVLLWVGLVLRAWSCGVAEAAMPLLAQLTVFAAALVSSVAGFAFSALAGSGLAHVYSHPAQAVGLMALCSIAIQSYAVIKLWRKIDWRRLAPFLAGGTLTVPLGVHWLAGRSYSAFALVLGLFLIGYGATTLWRRSPQVRKGNNWIDAASGALGDITGGIAAFPGAFVAIWCGMRGWDKSTQRGIVQPYILAMQLLTLACMHAQRMSIEIGPDTLLCVAAALLAARLGLRLFGALSNRQFGLVVNALLVVSGALLVVRSS